MEKLFIEIILNGDLAKLDGVQHWTIYDYFTRLNGELVKNKKERERNMKNARTNSYKKK